MIYGYARVSTREQNEERQIISLTGAGVERENIVVEKQSGKDFDRPLYLRLVKTLHEGDVLMIASIDRLGRNYDEILEQWRVLTKEKRVDIVVLDMPLLDTREDKGLTGRLIADIVLQLLSYVAQSERENIKKRQAEGIAAAKARGVHFGRLKGPLPEGFTAAVQRVQRHELTQAAAARELGMALSSFRSRCELEGFELPKKSRTPGAPRAQKTWYSMLKKHGLCVYCEKRRAVPGKAACEACAEQHRVYSQRYRTEQRKVHENETE